MFRMFFGSFSINVSSVFLNLLLVIFMTRILSPDQAGYYFYAINLVTFATVPTVLGLPNILMRYSTKYIVQQKWSFLKGIILRVNQVVLGSSAIIIVFSFFLIVILHEKVPALDKDTALLSLLLIMLISLSKIRSSLLRSLGVIHISQVFDLLIKNLLVLLFTLTAFFLLNVDLSASHIMIFTVVSAFVAFIVGQYIVVIKAPSELKNYEAEYDTKSWLISAVPILIAAGFKQLSSRTDILLLGMYLDPDSTAIYQVAVKIGEVILFSLIAFNFILAPKFSEYYYKGNLKKMQDVVTKSTSIIAIYSVFVFIIIIVFGKWILFHLFGSEYVAGYHPLVILSVGQLVNSTFGSVALILNMTGNEKEVAKGIGMAAGVNLLLCFALIPSLGMEGASIATAISTIMWNLYLSYIVYRKLGIITIPFLSVSKMRSER